VSTAVAWVALGLVPVLVALTRQRRTMPAGQDEVWFLLVATRLARGRRLYSEVFYGAGPLPVWGATLLVRLCDAGLKTLRTCTAVVLAATTVLLLVLVAPAGGLAVVCTAVALAGLVLARPPDNAYGVSARAGVAVSVAALAASDPDFVGARAVGGEQTLAALALVSGVGLVLALFSKHTLGAAAALTVLPGWLVVSGPSSAGVATGTTVVGSVAVLAVLSRRGELRGFVRRTLTDKGAYLSTGRLTFTGEAHRLARSRPELWWIDLTAYAVTVVAAVGTVVAAVSRTPGAIEALCLAAVSVAGNYPRASPSHVRAGAALALAALVVVLAPAPTALAVVLAALATVGGLALVASWRRPRRAPEVEVDVLDGLPLLSPMPARSLTDGERVRDTAGRRVLVLRSDAAQWYLALDLRNPTPYDYPLASTFGRSGQDLIAARLRRSDIEWCLMAPADAGPLTPDRLEEAVRSRMDPVLDTALGVLYRARHP
jgi:hypothetical protein